jgi:hypothetical protein
MRTRQGGVGAYGGHGVTRKACLPGGTSSGTSILLVVLFPARLCSKRTMLNPAYSLAFSHLCRRVRDGAPMVEMTEFAS